MSKFTFKGLSTPEDLIEMWRHLRHDFDKNDINVIWNYQTPQQLKPGFNIVNILYNPASPKEVGHYVLMTINTKTKEAEYYNPVAQHTPDDNDKIEAFDNYFSKKGYETIIDLSGKQTETSDNCGYHCLTHAYNLYNGFAVDIKPKPKKEEEKEENEGGAPANSDGETVEEKLDTLIKILRGIYYGNKYGYETQRATKPSMEKKKGRGYADYYHSKPYTYTGLKNVVQNPNSKY